MPVASEERDDVRVREAHRELGLVDEHVDEAPVRGELRQDPLDDEDLLEALDAEALGLEDLGHPAFAEALEQPIAAEGRSVHANLPGRSGTRDS